MHSIKRDMAIRLGLGGGILIVLIGLTIAISSDMSSRTENMANLRSELAARANSIDRLVRLRAQADQAVPYANALDELLPKPEAVVGFPREVRNLANAHRLTISNVSLGAETASTNLEPGSIEVQFSITGTLEDFTAFLEALEKRTGFIAFSSIDAPITNRVNALVRGKIFTQ